MGAWAMLGLSLDKIGLYIKRDDKETWQLGRIEPALSTNRPLGALVSVGHRYMDIEKIISISNVGAHKP